MYATKAMYLVEQAATVPILKTCPVLSPTAKQPPLIQPEMCGPFLPYLFVALKTVTASDFSAVINTFSTQSSVRYFAVSVVYRY